MVNKHLRNTNRWPTSAIRDGKWKLIYNESIDRTELFNISEDPFEQFDMAIQNPGKVAELKELWAEWKIELPE